MRFSGPANRLIAECCIYHKQKRWDESDSESGGTALSRSYLAAYVRPDDEHHAPDCSHHNHAAK